MKFSPTEEFDKLIYAVGSAGTDIYGLTGQRARCHGNESIGTVCHIGEITGLLPSPTTVNARPASFCARKTPTAALQAPGRSAAWPIDIEHPQQATDMP